MHVVSLLKRRLSNLHIITSTDSFITFNENDYKLNYGFLNLNYDIPVFLDDSILGKSIFESFLQHDDPTQDDCTGRKISFGGFYIDVFNDRKKIYKSKIFKKWTEQYNLNENLPYEFTIGYVETFSDNILNNYFFKNIKEVLWLQ